MAKQGKGNRFVIMVGMVLAAIFAASTAYSGMKAGLTVAAGIPGAIIGSGLVQAFAKAQGMQGKNLIQGMSSGGESIASGMIYVVPAIILIGGRVNFWAGIAVGALAVFFAVGVASVVEHYMVVEEDGHLQYPESQAIATALQAGETKNDSLALMAWGFGIGGLLTALSTQVLGWVNTTMTFFGNASYRWKFALEVNPMLAGIGFVVGMEVSVTMFAGSLLANFGITPLVAYFAAMAHDGATVWNAEAAVNTLSIDALAGAYSKYIGAGMMLCGGLIGAIKLIPVIKTSLHQTLGASSGSKRDLLGLFGLGFATVGLFAIGMLVANNLMLALIATALSLILALLFVIVSARMAGTIGCSNAPVSGMTIASLVVMTLIFVIMGWSDNQHTQWLLLFGVFIVTAISVGGAYTQTQKVNFLVQGDRRQLRKWFIVAALIGVVVVIATTSLLAPQLAETGANPAFGLPQANLIATLTGGIMSGNLPWIMIIIGVVLAIVCGLLRLPIMTVALGFYLPMATTSIILVGALLRWAVMASAKSPALAEKRANSGVSLASGLIAGGSLIGLIGIGLQVSDILTPGHPNGVGLTVGLLVILALAIVLPLVKTRRG